MRLHPDLAGAVEAATREADRTRRPQWLGLPVPAPVCDALSIFALGGPERFLLDRPDEELRIVALGAAHVIETAGARRFAAAAREAGALARTLHGIALPDRRLTPPLLVGGFAFGDAPATDADWRGFPSGRMVLPELAWLRRGTRAVALAWQRVDPGSAPERKLAGCREIIARWEHSLARCADPEAAAEPAAEFRAAANGSHAGFRAEVTRALRAIACGDLEKVVLARSVSVRRPGGFDPARVVDELRRRDPSCASFAVVRPGAAFVGATPERLLQLSEDRVETTAVAGSAPRGRSPEEDARLGRELLESKKEQAEHEIVLRAIKEALDESCRELTMPEAPRLLRLEAVQHLETPVHARLRRDVTLLELVGRLHPTPAVAGAPREAALAWLAEREGLERGWYAGPLGFVNTDGSGAFWVALRSALLRGDAARLFAGAGVVAGSLPDAELRETRIKLRAMLDALVEL
jgi:salicylate biosynthesis isochorismate synthase/menaquinone-specific isochorismate synthase